MKVLFTGGLGDFFTCEAHMTLPEKRSIRTIYLATPAAMFIREALKMHSMWAGIPVIEAITRDELTQLGKSCMLSLNDTNNHMAKLKKPQLLGSVMDMSISKIFGQIRLGQRKYNCTGIVLNPQKCPAVLDSVTGSNYMAYNYKREFTEHELLKIRERYGQGLQRVGVGHTTLAQAISLTAGCEEFIGIDSAMSVIAAISSRECGRKKRIFVRSENPHLLRNKISYYGQELVTIAGEYK